MNDDLKNKQSFSASKQSLTAEDADKQSLTAEEGNTNTPVEPVEETGKEEAKENLNEPEEIAKSETDEARSETLPTPEVNDSSKKQSAEQTPSEHTGDASDASQSDEQPSEKAPEQPAPAAPAPKKSDNPNAKWYVVHTYSGHENKVAATLKQRIESEHLEKKILDILVPTQDKIEIKGGKKATVKEKIFPGYILVRMDLDDTSWLAVRTTQGVTSFVGIGNKPTPISEAEVATIVKFTSEAAPTFKQVFAPDDTVRIVEGPFAEFIGKVDSVDEEKGKVRVLVSIFGRETPVELDFLQVQKI